MNKSNEINEILKEVVDKDIYYSKRIDLAYRISGMLNSEVYGFNQDDEADSIKCFLIFGDYPVHDVLYMDSLNTVDSVLDMVADKDKSGFVFRCICMEYFVFIGHYLSTDFSFTLFYNKDDFEKEANRLIETLKHINYRYIKQCGKDLSTTCFTNEINLLQEWYKKI